MKNIFHYLLFMFLFGCTKNNTENVSTSNSETLNAPKNSFPNSTNSKKHNKIKWGKNEEDYISALKTHSAFFKKNNGETSSVQTTSSSTVEECNTNNPFTYGYYDDPENLIVEGAHVSANSSLQESQVSSCSEMLATVNSAKTYLINEGYSDIVAMYDYPGYQRDIIHAANTLVELKNQMMNSGNPPPNARIVNCLLQAIGYSAIAELSANWAAASRQVIIRAVGKIAQRYLGWFGAAIAVSSFVDCMWFE